MDLPLRWGSLWEELGNGGQELSLGQVKFEILPGTLGVDVDWDVG